MSYAATRAADLGKLPPSHRTSLLRASWMAAASVAGVLGVVSGADAIAHRAPAEVTLGALVMIALSPLSIVAIMALVLRPGLILVPAGL